MQEKNYYITREAPKNQNWLDDWRNWALVIGAALGFGALAVYMTDRQTKAVQNGITNGMVGIEKDIADRIHTDITGMQGDLRSLIAGISSWKPGSNLPDINITLPDLSMAGTGQNITDLESWFKSRISGILPSVSATTSQTTAESQARLSLGSHPATPGLDAVAVLPSTLPSVADAIKIGGLFTTPVKKNEKTTDAKASTMTTISQGGQGIYTNDTGSVGPIIPGQEKAALDDAKHFVGGTANPDWQKAHGIITEKKDDDQPLYGNAWVDSVAEKAKANSPAAKGGWYVVDGVWRQHGVDGY